jgi:PhnB protein
MALPLGLSPYLVVSDANAAIAFYQNAFGATVLSRHTAPHTGKVMHSLLEIHGSLLSLSDDFPELMGGRGRTPQALGGTPVTLHLQVADADAAWAQAIAAGAKETMPLKEQFWGEKFGKFQDPFGHEWSMAQFLNAMSD